MTYAPEDFWQEFETTGSVTAYLAYREKNSKKTDSTPEENQENESE